MKKQSQSPQNCFVRTISDRFRSTQAAAAVGAHPVGNLLAGSLRDLVGSYTAVFFPVAALALVGAVAAALFLGPPVLSGRK